jgi:hypothetical protein
MKTASNDELNLYIRILEDRNECKYTNYIKLCDDLLIEFGVKVTKQRIIQLDEENLLVEDIKIIMKNEGINY